MGIFSKELYILDRNTERFMFEEMQRETEKMQDTLHRIESKYSQSLKNTVNILRDIGLSDAEILDKLCVQYQLEENQARNYL